MTTNPTPTPTDPVDSGPQASRSKRLIATAALATMVAGAAIAVPAAYTVTADQPSATATARATRAADIDLGDLTLAQLADELAEHGLEVRISPTNTANPDTEDDPQTAANDADSDQGQDDNGAEFGETLGSFPTNGDRIDLSSASSPEVADQAKEIWERFVALIPADQRQMVTGFELSPEEAGGAYVYPDETDPTKWRVGVSLGLGDELDYVLVHEFGHLLTLQASEVPPAADDSGSCPTYHTGEGCALSGSTMANFVQKFWPPAQVEQVLGLYENEDYDGLDAFYQQHKDDFVTDYATTNPAEDLAETFAHFVTKDRPTGNTVADQKVELLWDDPAMVKLRAEIRSNL